MILISGFDEFPDQWFGTLEVALTAGSNAWPCLSFTAVSFLLQPCYELERQENYYKSRFLMHTSFPLTTILKDEIATILRLPPLYQTRIKERRGVGPRTSI